MASDLVEAPQTAVASPALLTWRTWCSWALGFAVAAAAAVPLVNVAVDPYDLFEVTPLGFGSNTNQRYHHLKALSATKAPYDTLLLGTSVMGINDPRVVERLVPGSTVYNAAFFLASAGDLLELVRYLGEHDRLPRRMVIGVDTFLFTHREPSLSFEFRMPAEVAGGSRLAWWTGALFASSVGHAALKLIDVSATTPAVVFDRTRGNFLLPAAQAALLADPVAHARHLLTSAPPVADEQHLDPRQFVLLRELAEELERRHVSVLWLVQPNSRMLRAAYGPLYPDVERKIHNTLSGDVVDLADLQPLQDDPDAWYDQKHYTAAAGARVLETALRSSRTFGGLVTQR